MKKAQNLGIEIQKTFNTFYFTVMNYGETLAVTVLREIVFLEYSTEATNDLKNGGNHDKAR